MKRTYLYLQRLLISSLISITFFTQIFSQDNIRFDRGNFQNWDVKVGYKNRTNPNGPYVDEIIYNTNNNNTSFPEYNPQNITGIKLVSLNKAPITDRNFDVFPDFNQQLDTSLFDNVVKIGSATVTEPLPLARKISYDFTVTDTEKSFTYAYAILLEDGTHETDQQPKFTAKVFLNNTLIDCLSYEYQLPTNNSVIDEKRAIEEGFRKSKIPSETDKRSQRVWVRDWREMFIDLSQYSNNTVVTIEFEASNCIPAGHYAYAYLAISKNFGSPKITATKNICPGRKIALKVPNVKYASYEWKIINYESDFVLPGTNFNNYKLELQINPNPTFYTGQLVQVKINSKCFPEKNLSYPFDISKKAVGGTLNGPPSNLCEGSTATLNLSGYTGTKYILQKSLNKTNWTDITPPTDILSAIETPGLSDTLSYYRIKIYNNIACPLDSSSIAVIKMDTKSIPGIYEIPSTEFCKGQFQNTTLKLKNYKSKIVNWEFSDNGGTGWNNISNQTDALDIATFFNTLPPTSTLLFRTNVANGVCDTITKEISIKYNPNQFPGTTAYDTIICFGDTAKLMPKPNSLNDNDASYIWTSSNNLINDPINIKNAIVFPKASQDFYLSIRNKLCPNVLIDTFNVSVYAQMKIDLKDDKGALLRDPSIQDLMIGQPFVYNANTFNTDNNPSTFNYTWEIVDPVGYPSSQFVSNNNIATLTPISPVDFTKMNFVTINLKSINQTTGCPIERKIIARIFNGPPQIFVPTAFTPNNDGLNDTFKPFIPGVVLKAFRVFNRFGKVIFETSDSNASWDGTFNGVPQNPGTYVWQATGTGRDGSAIKPQKGTVTLIR